MFYMHKKYIYIGICVYIYMCFLFCLQETLLGCNNIVTSVERQTMQQNSFWVNPAIAPSAEAARKEQLKIAAIGMNKIYYGTKLIASTMFHVKSLRIHILTFLIQLLMMPESTCVWFTMILKSTK